MQGVIVSKICCHNELPISFINGKSTSGPRVYLVSELVAFSKHCQVRLGSIITSWLDSRAYPMYSVFGHADTWKSPVLMSLNDV